MQNSFDWSAVEAIATVVSSFVAALSFSFAIYTHFNIKSKKAIEAAKIAMQKERMRNVKFAVVNLIRSTDAIVQIPKHEKVTIEELQNLARIARAQAITLAKQLETEEEILSKWRFGELAESYPPQQLQSMRSDAKDGDLT